MISKLNTAQSSDKSNQFLISSPSSFILPQNSSQLNSSFSSITTNSNSNIAQQQQNNLSQQPQFIQILPNQVRPLFYTQQPQFILTNQLVTQKSSNSTKESLQPSQLQTVLINQLPNSPLILQDKNTIDSQNSKKLIISQQTANSTKSQNESNLNQSLNQQFINQQLSYHQPFYTPNILQPNFNPLFLRPQLNTIPANIPQQFFINTPTHQPLILNPSTVQFINQSTSSSSNKTILINETTNNLTDKIDNEIDNQLECLSQEEEEEEENNSVKSSPDLIQSDEQILNKPSTSKSIDQNIDKSIKLIDKQSSKLLTRSSTKLTYKKETTSNGRVNRLKSIVSDKIFKNQQKIKQPSKKLHNRMIIPKTTKEMNDQLLLEDKLKMENNDNLPSKLIYKKTKDIKDLRKKTNVDTKLKLPLTIPDDKIEKQKAIVKPQILNHIVNGNQIVESIKPFNENIDDLKELRSIKKLKKSKSNNKLNSADSPINGTNGLNNQTNNEKLKNQSNNYLNKSIFKWTIDETYEFVNDVTSSKEMALELKKLQFDGAALVLLDIPTLRYEFKFKLGPILLLIQKLGEYKEKFKSDDEIDYLPKSGHEIYKWTVDEVHEFILKLGLKDKYANEFKSQEIDGHSLCLLSFDNIKNHMKIDYASAFKIYDKIKHLKEICK